MTELQIWVYVRDKRIMYIRVSGEEFLNLNPPCNECLINNMCITDFTMNDAETLRNYIMIKYCQLLKKFIDNDKHFCYLNRSL